MTWPELWRLADQLFKYLAPAVITFAVFYVGMFLIRGYSSFIESMRFIFDKPGRVFFMILLFLVVWYLWEDFKGGLGW